MIIERNIAPYVVFAEDPILNALQKISANGQRIIFLVNESGILRGSLSDGDFRRWLIANPTASLETSALDAANTNPQTGRLMLIPRPCAHTSRRVSTTCR